MGRMSDGGTRRAHLGEHGYWLKDVHCVESIGQMSDGGTWCDEHILVSRGIG
jgi:hypothetical protein